MSAGPEDREAPDELGRLQRWLQAVITHPDGVEAGAASEEATRLIEAGPKGLEGVVTASRELTAAERLAIYANAYYSRLIECLGEVFPILKQTVGAETFDGFAFGYLGAYPSRSYTLNRLGGNFPRYLEETRPSADVLEAEGDPDWPQFLVDLARLEWVIYEVFDGPGMEERAPLTTDALLDLEISQWPQVCLRPVPCLRLLETRFPVNDYFTVASRSAEGAVSAWREPEASFTVVTRRNYIVRRYTLTEEEHLLLSRLVAGEPIGLAVEALASATLADEETLATRLNVWLRNWTAEGFFESVFFKEQP